VTGRYPGTPTHRRFLAAVAAHYASDPRVRAVCVFGSLGCGTWDEYSDVDLDVVVADDVCEQERRPRVVEVEQRPQGLPPSSSSLCPPKKAQVSGFIGASGSGG
jgi:hypothetical protein